MHNFLIFAASYGLTKCVKTMLVGTAFMAAIYAVAKLNRGRALRVNYCALLLLPLALLSGRSRLFYVRPFVWVSVFLNQHCTPAVGGLYFGTAFFLLAVLVHRNALARRRAFCLPEYGNRALAERVRRQVCAHDVTGIGAWYLRRVQIFVTPGEISPYCGGLLHPYVVLPACVCTWPEPAVEAVLCHELVHIRMGHLFVMALYRFLGCLWWVHPLFYAFEKWLHEVMEQVCDAHVMSVSGVERETYGELLLSLVRVLRKKAPAGSAAFFIPVGRNAHAGHLGYQRSDFQVLRARLAALEQTQRLRAAGRRVRCGFAALALLLALVLSATSYPRYTELTELGLYDEKLQLCAYDTAELNGAVRVEDGRLFVEPERFAALVESLGIEGEYVYLSFGGFMKVPGAGGGGNAGMISLSDYTDILYLRADVWENDAMEFLLKYFI